jgi:hypothetical protein
VSDPVVVLRLTGAGTPDSISAWIEALGRVPAERRIASVESRDDLDVRTRCRERGVELLTDAGVAPEGLIVLGRAADRPTPGSLRRLVSAVADRGAPHETRVLPYGSTAAAADGAVSDAPSVCVALPRGTGVTDLVSGPEAARAAVEAAGHDIRRLDSAAVLVDRRPTDSPAPAVVDDSRPRPYGHPAALPSTPLHALLQGAGLSLPTLPAELEERPFLTVVTRTQGSRLLCLEEVLTCLAAQSSRDFEVLLVCHRVPDERVELVDAVVASTPTWLQERVRVVRVERPGRAAPLNDALDAAAGRYVVALDDDDTVTTDWVATFEALEADSPGTVLRAGALRQDVVPVNGSGAEAGDVAPHEAGSAHPGWPAEFSLVDHLWDNASPFMTVAFPRGVFADLGLRFDESLDTNEDWDYLVRAACLAGVSNTSALTSVYRLWTEREGSRDVHHDAVWSGARASVQAGHDAQALLLPPGEAREIRALREALEHETAEKFRFAALYEQAAADLVTVNEAVVALRARIAQLEERLERRKQRGKST